MKMRRLLYVIMGLLLFNLQLLAQNRTISGRVTDEGGNPLSDVSVVVKGTSTGTTTKTDGTYSLSVPSNARTLVFTFVGLDPMEMTIGSGSTVNAQFRAASGDQLAVVVVSVPYGTVKKTAFTGSESTVTSRTLEKQQVTDVTRAIDGLIPGVIATNGGGQPGTGAQVFIRGIGSINASSAPLYVLNGVPYDGPINAISMDDIESVTVLKDATAAALYGSRAANGVIMITTKKGRSPRPTITATVRQGWMQRGIPEYDRVGPKEYYELMWEASRNKFQYAATNPLSQAAAGVAASNEVAGPNGLVYNPYTNIAANQLIDPVTGKLNPAAVLAWDESWEDALFRTAPRTNATVSISGQGNRSDYYLSLGYLDENGTMINTGFKRYNARLTTNMQATDWLNAGITIDGGVTKNNNVISTGLFTSNPFYYSRNMGPIYPIYEHNETTGAVVMDSLGNPVLDWGVPGQMGTRPYAGNSNLVGSLALDNRNSDVFNGNANGFLEAKFLKNFAFRTTLGYNLWDNNNIVYQNREFGDAQNVQGRLTVTTQRQISMTWNQVLSYAKEFDRHDVRVLAGHENYKYRLDQMAATKTGFQFSSPIQLSTGAVTEAPATSTEDNHTIESYFAGANYSFDQKYLLSASYRRDGSSRFAEHVRWGNFYSAGIGWRISQEAFLKSVSWINELKLKASYGEQGNDNIGLYYQYRNWYYADGTGGFALPVGQLTNPDLLWEGNKTFNAGFDFAFFDNRLQGTIEYFTRVSDNLLFQVPPALSVGGLSVWMNIGEMKNSGIEMQLGYNVIRKRNFDWRVDLNLTHFKNEITQLPPKQRETGIITGTKKLMEGKSIFDFWLREFAGVDASTGEALYYRDVLGSDGKPTGERTLTNNITNASYYYRGSAIPDFNGGLTNSFRYKGFDLSILTTFAYGGLFYDGNYAGLMHSGNYGSAFHTDIQKRWQKPGDITNVPRLQNGSTQDGVSDRFLFDASYINIKNITLSYGLPRNITDRIHLQGVRVFANVDNLTLITAKKGMDPQRAFNGTADNTFPPFRTYTVGLTVNLQ